VSLPALARTPAPALLTDTDKELIKDTWRLVEPLGETTADLFYRRLFELEPSYRSLFKADLTAQKRKLLAMLAFIVKSLSWVDASWRDEVDPESDLFLIVLALGRRHRELYAIPDEAYATVRDTLLWTLDYGLGDAFTPEAQSAWKRVYDLVATTMRLGKGATVLGSSIETGEGGRS
jgi:hemoglobin-like flavoprotein